MADDEKNVLVGAVLAGAIPGVAMLIAIFLVLCVDFSKKFQAMMQNFSAGIILAAVMSELYPIIEEEKAKAAYINGEVNPNNGIYVLLAISGGFATALAFMFGLELFLDEDDDDEEPSEGGSIHGSETAKIYASIGQMFLQGENTDVVKGDIEKTREAIGQFQIFLAERPTGVQRHECDVQAHILETSIHRLKRSLEGGSSRIAGRSRVRLLEHLVQLETYIQKFDDNVKYDVKPDKQECRQLLSKVCELSDHIHEHVERKPGFIEKQKQPKYFLRVRNSTALHLHHGSTNIFRSLSGAKANLYGSAKQGANLSNVASVGSTDIPLKPRTPAAGDIEAGSPNGKQMRGTYQQLDKVDSASQALVPKPNAGPPVSGRVPWSFVTAIVTDALVDGFLVGITYSAHERSGYIVAAATCVEMFFVGLTYSVQLREELGATVNAKLLFLFLLPPITLVVGSLGGAGLGGAFLDQPYLYIGFISFGIVALVFLVTHELLLAANENMDGEQGFVVSVWIFLGIWITWALDSVIPEEAFR